MRRKEDKISLQRMRNLSSKSSNMVHARSSLHAEMYVHVQYYSNSRLVVGYSSTLQLA